MEQPGSGTVLYCYAGHSVFGKRDIEWMSKVYNVKVAHFEIKPSKILKLMHFLAYNIRVFWMIWQVETVIINFGSWHTVLPVALAKFLNKKSIVWLGGFDAASIPSLEYGVFYKNNLLQKLMRWTYRSVTWISPVSEGLVYSVNKYADPTKVGYKIGVLHFIPKLANKIKVIPPEIDLDFWDVADVKRDKHILALAFIYDEQTLKRKGFDIVIECAKELPMYKFTFVGFSPEMIERYKFIIPQNITLLPFKSDAERKELYQTHKVYLFPTMMEGLGLTLCEALLCGCTSVASDVSMNRRLIGDGRFIVPYRDKKLLEDAIIFAMNNLMDPEILRERVLDYFKEMDRKILMMKLIEN